MRRGWRTSTASSGGNCVEVSLPQWRKATASYNNGCVEVASAGGRVWWRGAHIGAEYACGNCQQLIRLGPAPEAEGGPYWYHVSTSTIWCSGWGDPASTGAVAEPGS